jgi:MFS family permease
MRTAAAAVCLLLPFLPLAPTMPLLMLVLFIFGMCFGVLDVSMNVQAVAIEERHGLPIMSTFHGVFSIGGLLGAAVAGVAAGQGVAPFPHLLAVAVALGILQLVAGRYLLETRARQSDAPVFAVPPRSLLALGLLSFCVLLGEGAMADWSAVYMQNSLGASAAVAAAGYAGFSLAMAAMRFAGDALTITFGPVRMVRLGGLIAGLALAGAIATGTIPAALVGFTCVGIGLAASFPIALGAAGRTPGMAPGAAIGAVSTAGYTGLLIGPPVIGFISELTELRVGLLLVAALALATALLGGTVRRRG